ncbi:MAG: DpnD/PcfM family protein [Ignavibacteriales bacterium]|nr:DpnD/PcfM family protein [Ignavibacteriales bacterium]
METYNVEVREVLKRSINVNAKSIEEAVDLVSRRYKNEEIVLDYSDHIETSIDVPLLHLDVDVAAFSSFIRLQLAKEVNELPIEELAKIVFGDLTSAKEYYETDK